MRFIAEFVMRGRLQAIGVCLFGVLFPMMYWLSSAGLNLVLLRKGLREGLFLLLWTSLPIVVLSFTYEDPAPMMVLLGLLVGSAVLAYVLRTSESWEITLATAIVISGLGTLVFEYGAAGMMSEIVEQYLRFLAEVQLQMGEDNTALAVLPTQAEAHELLFGSIAMFFAYFMVLCLILSRWWQSELYNEGGFGIEFQSLRLSQGFSLVLILGLVMCYGFDGLLRWMFLLTMPLFMASIGFIHYFVKSRKLSTNWLGSFYMLMIFMYQLLAPILVGIALIDSWFDLRERIRSDREGS